MNKLYKKYHIYIIMIDPFSLTIAVSSLLMTLGHMYISTQNDIELLRRIDLIERRVNTSNSRRSHILGYYS